MRRAKLFLSLGSILALLAGAAAAPGRAPLAPQGTAAWLVNWSHRMALTVAPDSVSGTFTDFPVVLILDSQQQALFDGARADGADITVTKGDGVTPLAREIVEYDPGAPHAEIWFRADVLSPTDNDFYIYYGNPAADSALSDGGVWTDNFLGVYHFQGDPGSQVLTDSTPGHHDAVAGNSTDWKSSDVTAGQLGQAWAFDGLHHSISANALSTTDSSYTISAWANLAEASTDFAFQANPGFWHVSFQASGINPRPQFQISTPSSIDLRWKPNPVPIDGNYHLFDWVFDGVADTILFYFDGAQQPATNWWNPDSARYYTGRPVNPGGNDGVGIAGPMFYNDQDLVAGGVDEFRFSVGTRTGQWIGTQYRNQRDPAAFTAFGPEEDDVVPVHLLDFRAERTASGARVLWAVADGSDAFHVYRDDGDGVRKRLTPARLEGRTHYTFIDALPPSGSARYWLNATDRSGDAVWLGPAVLSPRDGSGLVLAQNMPNPFAGTSLIRFTLDTQAPVRLSVFNAAGRQVARLVDTVLPAGPHEVRWDGTADGVRLAPGVYLYRLDAGGEQRVRKLVLLP